jgi:hypothetical protein
MDILLKLYFTRLLALISLSFGFLFIILYPLIKKYNKLFAFISLGVGLIIIIILLYLCLFNSVIRDYILSGREFR